MTFAELEYNKRKILPLFPSSDHHLMIEAVIENNSDGKIFVDNTENPETAAVWTAPGEEALIYLGGSCDNASFNEQLRIYFAEVIKPESVNQGLDAFQFYPTDTWERVLSAVFKEETFRDRDSYYILDPEKFRKLQPTWRENIPEGFSLNRLESQDILGKAKNVPVLGEMHSWKTFDKFREHGIGYYLVEESTGTIVSGCMTKTVTLESKRCELAIGTDGHYQQRGLATGAACAVIDEALEKGLDVIWECYHGNTASIRTNQKLGFEYICDENFYFGFLYESLENLLFAGYYHFVEMDDPEKAAEWFEKAVAKSQKEGQPMSGGYNFYAACAFAAVNKFDLAIERLRTALSSLQDPERFLDRLKSEKAFENLRDSQDFKDILWELEKMIEEGADNVH